MYYVSVYFLAQRVLSHIRQQELLHAGDRLGVAVSGGIDSVALLRLLLELRGELGIVLSVVHFNHKLRGVESDEDQEFVAGLAREHQLELFVDGDDAALHAAEEHVSVETAARELRYGFFQYLLNENRPPGLKPHSKDAPPRGPEGPIFHGGSAGAAGSGSLSNAHLSNAHRANAHPANADRGALDKIATGHTLDDQAETVLMRVIRGTGLRGLGGIYPRIVAEDEGDDEACGEIIRPLLGIRRCELERYLQDIGQSWREDSTNADDRFTRNRVRLMVVPLLEREFNRAVSENLAELAEIARGEEDYWENEVSGWLGTVVQWTEPAWKRSQARLVQIETSVNGCEPDARVMRSQTARTLRAARPGPSTDKERPSQDDNHDLQSRNYNTPWLVMDASVDRRWLLGEPVAVQRRLVKAVGEHAGIPLEFKHVEEILRFAAESGAAGKRLSLPLGWTVLVEPEALIFLAPDPRHEKKAPLNYEYELNVPGRVNVPEIGLVIEAFELKKEAEGYNPEHLLNAKLLREPLRVRNWRPGDRFWPAHTKAPKKIKELLQEQHIAQPERGLWPVVVMGDEIVWVRGFAVPARLRAKVGSEGVLIRETPLDLLRMKTGGATS